MIDICDGDSQPSLYMPDSRLS